MGKDDLLSVHLLPVRPAIFRTINGTRFIPGIDQVGIVWVERQRPDIHPPLGGFQGFPVLPPVVATIWSSMRAGKQDGRVVGMHEQRPHLWVWRQSVGQTVPLTAVCGIPIEPTATDMLSLPCQPDVHEGPMIFNAHEVLLYDASQAEHGETSPTNGSKWPLARAS